MDEEGQMNDELATQPEHRLGVREYLKDKVPVNYKFQNVVIFFEQVQNFKMKKQKEFIEKFFDEHVLKNKRTPFFTFSILRLILPHTDRDRGNYGLKEKKLAKLISKTLGLDKEKQLSMEHFKNPTYQKAGNPTRAKLKQKKYDSFFFFFGFTISNPPQRIIIS